MSKVTVVVLGSISILLLVYVFGIPWYFDLTSTSYNCHTLSINYVRYVTILKIMSK